MKRFIMVALLGLQFVSSSVLARDLVTGKKSPTVQTGLYSAPDTVTGYNQIYYRSPLGIRTLKLTTTDADKSMPKWGPSGVAFRFYDSNVGETQTCKGRIFYYLEASDTGQNNLMMGCVSLGSPSKSVIVEGHPLTGLGFGPTDIQDYEVAEGDHLFYEFHGVRHAAYAIILETDEGEIILLHDTRVNSGQTNYKDGLVVYYEGEFDDSIPGWESLPDDDIDWDGTIPCPYCLDPAVVVEPDDQGETPEEPVQDAVGDAPEVETSNDTNLEDEGETQGTAPGPAQTTIATSTGGTTSSSVNSSINTVTGSSSVSDTINISVSVEVNTPNIYTSSSAASADLDGVVSANSSDSIAVEETEEVGEEIIVTESESETIPATPTLTGGGKIMVGGGGCSLKQQGTDPGFSLAPALLIFVGLSLILKSFLLR